MPDEFKIDNSKLEKLAKKFKTKDSFSLSSASCKKLFNLYSEVITERIRRQHLAHIIRSLESYLQEKTGNSLFTIKCYAVDLPFGDNTQGHYRKGRCFDIYYNKSLSEDEVRICLSHELGHLFLEAYSYMQKGKKLYEDAASMEPLSSLFGIFTIASKNDFYQNEANSCINGETFNGLVDKFLSLGRQNAK
ncbi:hypothetical protein AGMMS49938_06950 [Fibrobacterales bacterium]|nr:hypothetical protein AGMMS49938_06950 [Fibrobacterales bacterium]